MVTVRAVAPVNSAVSLAAGTPTSQLDAAAQVFVPPPPAFHVLTEAWRPATGKQTATATKTIKCVLADIIVSPLTTGLTGRRCQPLFRIFFHCTT
jgi:hypothetical protein